MKYYRRAVFGGLLAVAAFASPVLADSYRIDPGHTQVTFTVKRFGFNHVIGAFDKVTGTFDLDEDNPENSGASVSIDTTSLYTGNPERDVIVHSRFWLNTENYPTITFTSTAVEKTGEDTAKVSGNLTLLGVTRPVILDATLHKIGTEPAVRKKAAGFTATARLLRSDYGLTTAVGPIGDGVLIRIEVLGIAE